MTIAKCTEGGEGIAINIDLCSGFDNGPYLGFLLPVECYAYVPGYDGDGCFSVDLRDLLEEELNNHIAFDWGEDTHKTVSILREYADKLEASAKEFAHKADEQKKLRQAEESNTAEQEEREKVKS